MALNEKDPFENALNLTNWALDKAWKIAVRRSGITDWSETKRDHPEKEREIELDSFVIAKMLLDNIGKTEGLRHE